MKINLLILIYINEIVLKYQWNSNNNDPITADQLMISKRVINIK